MLLSSVCGALLQIMVLHPALGEPVEATPPVAVDTPVPNSGLERFTEPQLLSNGTTFLEIWRTEHVTYLDSYDTPSGVSFRLFSADGDALVPLHDGDLDTAAADWMTAARLGEDYYVLWNATDTDYSAKAARVDGETGEILETKEVAFAGAPDLGVQKVDAILPGEGDALLLWQSGGIYAAVLDPATLELQGEEPTLLSSVPGGYGPWLATARSGDRILVGYGVCEETGYYQYECAVYADLFDLETNSLVSSFLIDEYAFDGLSSHPTTSLSVGEDGERFVLLWMLYGASDIPTLWGYSAITHVLDAQTGALLNESSLEEFPQQPRCDKAMARIGDRYMAACTGWEAEDGETVAVDSLLLDRETGALLSEKSVVSSDSAFRFGSPMAEVSGDRFLVAWQEEGEDPSGGGILGAFVDVDGGVDAADGGMTVAERNNSEIRPAIAASGGNALVVWMDGRNPEWEDFDIYGVRVDPEGVPLDPDAIPIGTGAGDQREPAVASNGSDYLVVWQAVSTASASASGLWGALVDGGTGELVPGGAFEIPTAYEGRNPRAAARPGGDRFLVTFDDIRHEEDNSWTYGVFGVWVDAASGAILSPEPFLVGQTDDATNGDLVWTGSRYLSVFLNRSGSDVNVNAFLVDAAETPAEADALFVGEGAETYSTYPPRAAVLGGTGFVVWRNGQDLRLAGLDLYSGASSSPVTVGACWAGGSPSIATDGYGALAVWSCPGEGGAKPRLRAVRINAEGGVPDEEPIDPDPTTEGSAPALASGPLGFVLAQVMELPHVWRVATRRVTVSDYPDTPDVPDTEDTDDTGDTDDTDESTDADTGADGGGTGAGGDDAGGAEDAGEGASPEGSCACTTVARRTRRSMLSILL